jgi:Rps23 Pro-64 3,4-dihydroxylase Tpa1-like proline 4-hydroxylase
VDVQPVGGTLIVFDANRMHHKVLPSHKDRLAITCWINGVLK